MLALDAIDRSIILDMRKNCRITFRTLAEKNGISSNAIRKRVDKLLELGVIQRFLVQLSHATAELDVLFGLLYTDKSIDDDKFADLVFQHPSVIRVHFDSFGSCVVFAEYSGAVHLNELSSFLRGLESVTNAEFHQLPVVRGQKVALSKLQLRVLAPLLDDPRMSISDISQRTGLTARRVRRAVDDLIEGGGIEFTLSLNLSAADAVHVAFRVQWDFRTISPDETIEQLKREFPNEYWSASHSATEPLTWCNFLVDHSRDVEKIAAGIRRIPSATIETTILVYPPRKMRHLREQRLRELVSELD
ncbi:MAG: winged helix-turn-helix transcriptional regulator [Candidatus Thorarchaeota archaeon]